jgi:hypothetical protein
MEELIRKGYQYSQNIKDETITKDEIEQLTIILEEIAKRISKGEVVSDAEKLLLYMILIQIDDLLNINKGSVIVSGLVITINCSTVIILILYFLSDKSPVWSSIKLQKMLNNCLDKSQSDFDKLLDEYVHNYFHTGNLNSNCYFIGMEEGGGDTKTKIIRRLTNWLIAGKPNVSDLHPGTRFVKTWAGMIRLILANSTGGYPNLSDVKIFQAGSWGMLKSNNYVGELLPLPSPGKGTWNYNMWSTLPYLRSRAVYEPAIIPRRTRILKNFIIRNNELKLVVFYGFGNMPEWEIISDIGTK